MRNLLNYMATATLSLLMLGTLTNAQTFSSGNDYWETNPASTFHILNLPADAIADGSDPIDSKKVYLKGNPEAGSAYDTNIKRNNSVSVPRTTSLTVVELNMMSVEAFPVSFNNGSSTKYCKMFVGLSSQSSKGSMTINNNGTFSSSLKVIPKLTFECSDGLGWTEGKITRVIDMGSPMVQSMMKSQAAKSAKNIKAGRGTDRDRAFTAACAEQVPKTANISSGPISRRTTSTPQQSSCGLNFRAKETWGTCGPSFCVTRPLTEEALLASHGISPVRLTHRTEIN